jgi:type II secretory pathway pseudopilin PulG
MRRFAFFVSRARREAARDEGFTMIEVVIAATVMLTAVLALAYTAAVAFPDIALARQRQGATGLANEAIEQAKALPFDTLAKGLATWDVTGDANITTCGANQCFLGERIPTSGYAVGTNIVPLVPHRRTMTVGQTSYTVAIYVTNYKSDPNNRTYTLTSIVTWANPARHGVSARVQTQTIVYSPAGCLSTATHPFAAPCQPFVYGTGAASEAAITLTGSIAGLDLERATLRITNESSTMQVEQISAVQGTAKTSAIILKELDAAELSKGRNQAATGADNDPSQPDSDYQTIAATPQAAQQLALSSSNSLLTLFLSAADVAQSTSTTSASITPAHLCPDPAGVNQTDTQACGNSQSRQMNTTAMVLELERGGSEFGAATLAAVKPAPQNSVAFTNRAVVPEGSTCPTTSGSGCVHVEVKRYMGEVDLGGLPANLSAGSLPAGWGGYLVYMTGLADTVMAEGGVGTAAPTLSRTGTIWYWDGAGYSSIALGAIGTVNIPVAPLTVFDSSHGSDVTVVMSADLDAMGTSTSETIDTCIPACPSNRTDAEALSGAPILGTITYQAWRNGSLLADLTIDVNLGQILAQASYQKAPTG